MGRRNKTSKPLDDNAKGETGCISAGDEHAAEKGSASLPARQLESNSSLADVTKLAQPSLGRQLSRCSAKSEESDGFGPCHVKFKRLGKHLVLPAESSPLEVEATAAEEAGVCWSRHGRVLRKQQILKADHAPGIIKKGVEQPLQLAPNFRSYGAAGGALPVFGVGQPSMDGCGEVLAAVHKIEPHVKRILWFTLRDELGIFINGRPYAVRDRQNPIDYSPQAGHTSLELQQLELTLKQEIIDEAKANGGRVLLHGERPGRERKVYSYWEVLDEDELFCQHELFLRFRDLHHPELRFARFPITDNSAPEEKEFDAFVRELLPELRQAGERHCALVFNCLMGQGRTTTGMVVSALLCQVAALGDGAPSAECVAADASGGHRIPVVSEIVDKLLHGRLAQRWVDSAIDECGHMVHLRKVLEQKRRLLSRIRDWDEWDRNRKKYISFTERYAYLVLFAHYIWTETQEGAGSFPRSPHGFQLHMQHLQKTISIYAMFEDFSKLGGAWGGRSGGASTDQRQKGREGDSSQWDKDHRKAASHGGRRENAPAGDAGQHKKDARWQHADSSRGGAWGYRGKDAKWQSSRAAWWSQGWQQDRADHGAAQADNVELQDQAGGSVAGSAEARDESPQRSACSSQSQQGA